MRSIWKGSIAFGLVNVPVKVYSATEDHDLKFHQVHAKDNGRIRYQRVCEECGEVVEYRDIAKAFQGEDGQMVVITDEGTIKVTDVAEIPSKGRATGGVRVVRFKGFETNVAYAWVGRNRQLAAIVADPSDIKKTDPTPVPVTLEATRRDGSAVDFGHRILALGEDRLEGAI